MVCIEVDSADVVDIAIGRGADVAAVVDVCELPVSSEEKVEVVVDDVDNSCALDVVVLVGRIQNCRLQNPKLASAFASPKASTALMAKGASQSGSQVIVQSRVSPE
jgi:hypothetical protein